MPESISSLTHSTVDVTVASAEAFAADANRRTLILQNTSLIDFYLNFAGDAAAVYEGVHIPAKTTWEMSRELGDVMVCAANVIAPSAPGVKAVGTLTFSSTTADGEVVVIGEETYEFDTNATITAGNILVDISGGASAAQSATALIAAITASSALVAAATGGTGVATVTANYKGVYSNDWATTTTCGNGLWSATTLGGSGHTVGVDGTYLLVSYATVG